MWMFLRCVGKKPTLSLSHSVCSDVLLLHLFLKSAYLLLCCDLFFPALSQSMHSATGNKFDLGSVPTQSLFCTILTYIVYALSYFPQEAHFCIKKKDRLISVSVLCCCSEQREPVPTPWLQLVPQSTAGKNPGFDCQLHSGFSKHICESSVQMPGSSSTAQSPASDFKLF